MRVEGRGVRGADQERRDDLVAACSDASRGRKLRAIRRCIGDLNEDIEVIIRRGLILADEIAESVSRSLTRERVEPAEISTSPSPSPVSTEVARFPAIERGLRAKERLSFQRGDVAARERSPFRDRSNLLYPIPTPTRSARVDKSPPRPPSPREGAAAVIQRRYRSHLGRWIRSATLIQTHVRSYLSSLALGRQMAQDFWEARERERLRSLLRRWRGRAKLREAIAARARRLDDEREGAGPHHRLGRPFDGAAIKPIEGVFMMAKEYQLWRYKATTFVKWLKLFTTQNHK